MSLMTTFGKMVVILFAIAMGFLANRLGYFSEEINRKLTKLVLNITMPCMILASVLAGNDLPDINAIISFFKILLIFYGLEALFMLVAPHIIGGTPAQKNIWRFVCLFPNASFIAYPVIEALFGEGAIFYAVMLCLPYNVINFSFGPALLGGGARFRWKALCTPAMICSAAALVFALGGIRAPALIGDMLDFVGDVTVPLSLLVLGSVLAGLKTKNVFAKPRLWVLSAFRLLIMPVTLLLLLRPVGLDPVVLGVVVVEMAMPAAVNGAMLCMEYNGDIESMAQTIFVTTILSVVTIPLVAMLL